MRATSGVPIVVEGRPWGVAIAEWRSDEPPPAGGEQRLAQFTELARNGDRQRRTSRDAARTPRARVW